MPSWIVVSVIVTTPAGSNTTSAQLFTVYPSHSLTVAVEPSAGVDVAELHREGEQEGEAEEEGSERRSIWGRWWVWVLIGGAVAGVAVVAYVAAPSEVEDHGVTLRIQVP